ncbi:Pfs, NACHT and ankyrin domain protein, partial [Lophiostoma macrostomum CBS 122681]
MESLQLTISLLVSSLIVLAIRHHRSQITFHESKIYHDARHVPPTYPYIFPLLGSLPLAYLWDPKSFVLNSNNWFQARQPIRVKVPMSEFFVIQGAENIKAMFRNSAACTSIPFVKFAVERGFGLPARAVKLYDLDDSGGGHVPHPDSSVEARNRVDYRTHQSMSRFLIGEGGSPFWHRFADYATTGLCELHRRIGNGGEVQDDLMQLVGDEVMAPFLDAICGPHLLRLNPRFLEDFWEFDHHMPTLLKGIPRLFSLGAHACRTRALDAVKKWHNFARENYTAAALSSDGDDPFWGTKLFRERHAMFLDMDGFDRDAVASEDLGAIARNSISATSWTVYELFRDPELLRKIREETDSCVVTQSSGRIQFDIDRLLRLPLLQSVYAETLRLRMHFYLIRMPDKVDMAVKDWMIPRQKVIVTSTTAAHMDRKAWNTGFNNEHPVTKFWSERFLTSAAETGKSTFSVKEVEGSWIPYGGGPRQCPGRHFAKRQILLSTALIITLFDCDFLEPGLELGEDPRNFGMGVAQATRKVPVRLSRR